MLYLILSALSFGTGWGLLVYVDNKSLPPEKESVAAGAGVSAIFAGVILVVYGIVRIATKGGW